MPLRLKPKPLCLSMLKPRMHIEVRTETGNRLCCGYVKEVTNEPEPRVILYDKVLGGFVTMFAADKGLVPYASGRWSDQQRTYEYTNRHPSDFLRPDKVIPGGQGLGPQAR